MNNKKNHFILFSIWLLFFVLFFILFFSQIVKDKKIPLAIDTVAEKMAKKMNKPEQLKKENLMTFKKRYSLEPSSYPRIAYYGPSSNMAVDELLIIEIKNDTQVAEITTAMERRIKNQKVNFDGYGTNQMSILNKAKILSKNGYMVLIISDNSSKLEEFFSEELQKGGK